MRLCIRDFRHGRVIQAVDEHTRKAVGDDVMQAERVSPPDQLAGPYLAAAKKIAPALEGKLPPRGFGNIWLNCSETELFSPRSSVLNRLICAYLYNNQRFRLFEGRIVTPIKRDGETFEVLVEERPDITCKVDEVIVRHGPDKALKTGFPRVWDACQALAAEWQSVRQHEDWTRERLYSENEFLLGGQAVPPLRIDFGERVGCVLVTGSSAPVGLDQEQRVNRALRSFKQRTGDVWFGGRVIDTDPVLIRAEDALASSANFERAVRALCETEIAVFDITGLEAAVMLFLGIRAAVRRGVTLTITKKGQWTLPFNLASLNPIPMGPGDLEQMAAAMESGVASLKARPNTYLDLPVFDAIRQLGDDFVPKEPDKEILVLRWFDPQYGSIIGDVLSSELKDRFGRNTTIVTTLDSRSPQLVEQRLYADIRRTKVCVADWTGWRPNVFFEIGVRLAVNKVDPVFIVCTERPPGWDETSSKWPESVDPSRAALEVFSPRLCSAFVRPNF
jgi:hypothetical protein